MQRVRYKGPNFYRPHSSQLGYFSPTSDDTPRSHVREYAPTPKRISADEMEALCLHEASHAVLALVEQWRIDSIHIDSTDGTGLCCTKGNSLSPENQARRELRFFLAGEAGVVHAGFPASQARAGSGSDLKAAKETAAELLGLDVDDLSDDDEEAIEALLNEERSKAARALERNWALIKEIAGELETRGRLNGDQIARIVEDFPLEYPPKRTAPVPVRRFDDAQLQIRRLPFGLSVCRDMPIIGKSFDATTREVDAIISTGRAVRRSDWEGEFDEVLEISDKAVRLERLNAGAQLLDSHRWFGGIDAIVGAVVPGSARIENGKLLARFKFSDSGLGRRVSADIADGIPLQLSCGYKVHAYKEDRKSDPPVRRVVDWEPMEVSIVSVPAEGSGTGFRGHMMAA